MNSLGLIALGVVVLGIVCIYIWLDRDVGAEETAEETEELPNK